MISAQRFTCLRYHQSISFLSIFPSAITVIICPYPQTPGCRGIWPNPSWVGFSIAYSGHLECFLCLLCRYISTHRQLPTYRCSLMSTHSARGLVNSRWVQPDMSMMCLWIKAIRYSLGQVMGLDYMSDQRSWCLGYKSMAVLPPVCSGVLSLSLISL